MAKNGDNDDIIRVRKLLADTPKGDEGREVKSESVWKKTRVNKVLENRRGGEREKEKKRGYKTAVGETHAQDGQQEGDVMQVRTSLDEHTRFAALFPAQRMMQSVAVNCWPGGFC